jgi:hypothetical protein
VQTKLTWAIFPAIEFPARMLVFGLAACVQQHSDEEMLNAGIHALAFPVAAMDVSRPNIGRIGSAKRVYFSSLR